MTLHELAPYAIAALGGYLAWIIYRLARLRRRARSALPAAASFDGEIHSQILGGEFQPAFSSVSYDSRTNLREEPARARDAASLEGLSAFSADEVQVDLISVRRRLADLEEKHAELGALVESLQEALRELQAVRPVSSVYHDAVSLARRGFVAEAIAERCGISVAEAQLVAALSTDANKGNEDE